MKVLKFGAVWCNGCLVMRPRWAEIEKEHPELKTEYVEFDTEKELVQKYGVDSGVLPVFIFLDKKGEEILRMSGEIEKPELLKVLRENENK
jgi:thiol-disulfide isomerase/thioredoxin